ncbi:hypothetical protein LCI18_013286 [Fusarium solani-melongenae]|uniref:Uncharacterized protein n=1 Tax=Fusarium solani subsp. cucurbitae TaxID=2747967 RepID=A0ACD3ZNC3_FUSSC|nr:hypothetical protein LCI18_013286 [Fusarium solani-melongenae]
MAPSALIETPFAQSAQQFTSSKQGSGVQFSPAKHLAYSPPSSILTMKDLALEPTALSPVATSEPFPLLSHEAVLQHRRDLFSKDVLDNCLHHTRPGSFWHSPEVLKIVSDIAGVELVPAMDYEISHTNVQLGPGGLDAVRNTTVEPPEATAEAIKKFEQDKPKKQEVTDQTKPIIEWHKDSHPWVCVVMLSDARHMSGGETELMKGDGTTLKVKAPQMGRYISHTAAPVTNMPERVTIVTSFRPKNPLLVDDTTNKNVRNKSHLTELYYQWTTYRLDVIAQRARIAADALKERYARNVAESDAEGKVGLCRVETVSPEEIKKWSEEMIKRKKCDSTTFPCGNCRRLGLDCNTETRLVWEDDSRRAGMKRRGPSKFHNHTNNPEPIAGQPSSQRGDHKSSTSSRKSVTALSFPSQSDQEMGLQRLCQISEWPFELDPIESHALNHYIQRFSRTYPTCAGPTNPFLRIFLPLSMQSRVVLDAVLTLSCVQSWEYGSFAMERPMLFFRYKALRGCRELIESVMKKSGVQNEVQSASTMDVIQVVAPRAATIDDGDIMHLLATCVLMILYEKLSGERQENWNEAMAFLSSLFLYNDLVRSTSLRTSTLSDFYIRHGGPGSRFEFPTIIARLSAGDLSVTDQEIAVWDGRLDWFPSFALDAPDRSEFCERLPVAEPAFVLNPHFRRLENFARPETWSEQGIVSELYRIAASVYRKQKLVDRRFSFGYDHRELDENDLEMGNLPSWGVELLYLLSPVSPYDNTLLWPISIIAKELTDEIERQFALNRVESLEKRFSMKHFSDVREYLVTSWMAKDEGIINTCEQLVLFG